MIPESILISPTAFDRFLDMVENEELEFLKDRPFVLSWVRDGNQETSDPLYLVGWKMEAKSRTRVIQMADSEGHICTTVYDTFREET